MEGHGVALHSNAGKHSSESTSGGRGAAPCDGLADSAVGDTARIAPAGILGREAEGNMQPPRATFSEVEVPTVVSRRTVKPPAAPQDTSEGMLEECGSDEPLEPKLLHTLRHWLERIDPVYPALLKWSLTILLLLFLSAVVFGVFYSGFAYHGDSSGHCSGSGGGLGASPCDTPFGTILGVSDGVVGYSNCNSAHIADDDSYMPVYRGSENGAGVALTSLYAGLQWQCVEYARRYWMLQGRPEPAYFGSVEGAADIWRETYVTTVLNASRRLRLRRFLNGHSVTEGVAAPRVSDILIYARDKSGDFPYGHVAVIVGVNSTHVQVAEQNWESRPWPGPYHNYSRALPLLYNPTALTYTIVEPKGPLLGWMRYGDF